MRWGCGRGEGRLDCVCERCGGVADEVVEIAGVAVKLARCGLSVGVGEHRGDGCGQAEAGECGFIAGLAKVFVDDGLRCDSRDFGGEFGERVRGIAGELVDFVFVAG